MKSHIAMPGFHIKTGKYEYFIAACSEYIAGGDADDDCGDEAMPKKSHMSFADSTQQKLDMINLTACASGVTACGHRRTRLRKLRDAWVESKDPHEVEAAKRFTTRLELAEDAVHLSQAAVLHSMDK